MIQTRPPDVTAGRNTGVQVLPWPALFRQPLLCDSPDCDIKGCDTLHVRPVQPLHNLVKASAAMRETSYDCRFTYSLTFKCQTALFHKTAKVVVNGTEGPGFNVYIFMLPFSLFYYFFFLISAAFFKDHGHGITGKNSIMATAGIMA